MRYALLIRENFPGYSHVWREIYHSDRLEEVSGRLKSSVESGTRVSDLRIVNDIDFELKMAVKFKEESDHDS